MVDSNKNIRTEYTEFVPQQVIPEDGMSYCLIMFKHHKGALRLQ